MREKLIKPEDVVKSLLTKWLKAFYTSMKKRACVDYVNKHVYEHITDFLMELGVLEQEDIKQIVTELYIEVFGIPPKKEMTFHNQELSAMDNSPLCELPTIDD